MQEKLHKFMDKMGEKTIEERQRILMGSTILGGMLITVLGVWNITSNLFALTDQTNAIAEGRVEEIKPSVMDKLKTDVASVWGSVRGGMKDLNDKLGTKPNDIPPEAPTQ